MFYTTRSPLNALQLKNVKGDKLNFLLAWFLNMLCHLKKI